MRNTGLPWLYDLYTNDPLLGELGVDFGTIAQAYMTGEAAAYGDHMGRAKIVADQILAACPITSDPGLLGLLTSAETKKAMLGVGLRELLFDNGQRLDLAIVQKASEDVDRALMGLALFAGLAKSYGKGYLGDVSESDLPHLRKLSLDSTVPNDSKVHET